MADETINSPASQPAPQPATQPAAAAIQPWVWNGVDINTTANRFPKVIGLNFIK